MNVVDETALKFENLKERYIYLIIAAVGFLLYGRTILFSFTYCDDIQLIAINHEFLSHLSNLPKLFMKDVFISMPNPTLSLFFRPILNVSFMLDAQIGGDAPWFYHFTNVVLHVVCSLLVFVLFKKLKFPRIIATSAAIIFSVHPLLASAVSWLPGRNDSLLALFILSSFIFFLKYIEEKNKTHLVMCFLFWAIALFTKETAVVFPVIVLLYLFMVRREPIDKKLILIMAFFWIVLASLWWYMRSNVVQNVLVSYTPKDFLLAWLSNAPAFVLYLGKMLFPFNLSVFPNLQDNSLWLGIATILSLAVLILMKGEKNYRMIIWGALWFFLFLAPSLLSGGILPEHRAYCPLVGFLIVFYELPFIKNLHRQRGIIFAVIPLVVVVYAVISFLRCNDFRNRETFYTNAYEKSPSCDALYPGLAGMFIDQKKYDAGEAIIQEGFTHISSGQDKVQLHRMLGDIYAEQGKRNKAEEEYIAAITIDSIHIQSYVSYGKLCLSQGRLDDTEKLWKRTIAIHPDYIQGYYLLANFFLQQRSDTTTATFYIREIEKRGLTVMPELLNQIASYQKNHTQTGANK